MCAANSEKVKVDKDMKRKYSFFFFRSMIEMLGVMAIVGILSVGGIAGYIKAMAKYRTNRIQEQASMLIANIRTLYTNQKGFTGLNEEAVQTYELASADMLVTEGNKVTALQNAMGGKVSLEVLDNGLSFRVAFGGLDRMACINVATQPWEFNASSGLEEMQIGTGGSSPDEAISLDKNKFNWENDSLPISLNEAAATCQESDNAISWQYGVTAY